VVAQVLDTLEQGEKFGLRERVVQALVRIDWRRAGTLRVMSVQSIAFTLWAGTIALRLVKKWFCRNFHLRRFGV